ncbi:MULTISPECIES: hypothetical protein [Cloacibacillus]|uniref:hypothetical protein n=1 Tax=Cloacibacillus TaxID=508459 RepID=UPI002109D9AD|nr:MULTISPECIES: hypothetical protein [Cloacibacillus]MCQ4765074.1 hypothetical protein [Cloacibacillus evryensis]
MIRIEDGLIKALEDRIVRTVADTAPSIQDDPETFVVTIESRKFEPNKQVESRGVMYGKVEAEVSVCFFSQKTRYDYSAMMADFANDPFLQIEDALPAMISDMNSETALEGPYLTTDVWGFQVHYYISGTGEDKEWQLPQIHGETPQAAEIFPIDEPYDPNSPEAVLDVQRL